MTQCGFKQQFFTKASFESKSKSANGPEISYKKYGMFCHFFCSLCKSRKSKDKSSKHSYESKKDFFISIDIPKSPMSLG